MIAKGKLFVVSAPSGSGKSTLIKALLKDKRVHNLVYAVSHTSRRPRPGEIDGEDYVFVSPEDFRAMIVNGEFLEWTKTYDYYYGTSAKRIMLQLDYGYNVITDVDVVGAKAIRDLFPEAILIFISVPSFKILKERLSRRATETLKDEEKRLAKARSEVAEIEVFDFLIVNDDMEKALSELVEVINTGEGPRAPSKEELWEEFFKC
ncbi:MAG: guanylate kinase [Deltaproteobacteria bacterium]|jgi:guanylate kinase|nr:guanylate kinase [Deltaproteobacteria bacterium]